LKIVKTQTFRKFRFKPENYIKKEFSKNASRAPIKLYKINDNFIAAVVFAAGFAGYSARYERVKASSSGPSPSFTGAPGEASCTACHSEFPVNSGAGNVSIAGLPANYLPNQAIPLSLPSARPTPCFTAFN
jgi:cytochrome c553